MKYIDAEGLLKEIKRLERAAHKSALDCADSETRKFHEGKALAYQFVGILIDSLQQEGPLEKTFDDYLKATPAERRKMDMTKILGAEKLAKVKEMMEQPTNNEQDQQEVDFKIEERKWVHDAVDNIFPEDGDFMSEVDFRKILKDTARHFYELGRFNARKEE